MQALTKVHETEIETQKRTLKRVSDSLKEISQQHACGMQKSWKKALDEAESTVSNCKNGPTRAFQPIQWQRARLLSQVQSIRKSVCESPNLVVKTSPCHPESHTLSKLEDDLEAGIEGHLAGTYQDHTKLTHFKERLEQVSTLQDPKFSCILERIAHLFCDFERLLQPDMQRASLVFDKAYDYLSVQWQPREFQSELTWLYDALKHLISLSLPKATSSTIEVFQREATKQLLAQVQNRGLVTLQKHEIACNVAWQTLIQQRALDIHSPCLPDSCVLFLQCELLRNLYFNIDNRERLEVACFLLENVESYKPKLKFSLENDQLLNELYTQYRPSYPPEMASSAASLFFRLSQASQRELSLPMTYLFYAKATMWIEQIKISPFDELKRMLLLVKGSLIGRDAAFESHFASLTRAIYTNTPLPLLHASQDYETGPLNPLKMLLTQYVLLRARQNLFSLIDFEREHLLKVLSLYLRDRQTTFELLMFQSLVELEHLLYLVRDQLRETILQTRGEEQFRIWLGVMKNFQLFLNNYKILPRGVEPEYIQIARQALTDHPSTIIKACLEQMLALWKTRT